MNKSFDDIQCEEVFNGPELFECEECGYMDADPDICPACDGEGRCFEDDGQPTEYEEWQDVYGGDDWDHGQFDDCDW